MSKFDTKYLTCTYQQKRKFARIVRPQYLVLILVLLAQLLQSKDGYTAESVSLQLSQEHQLQYAGFYAALWRDIYADSGLDVDILPADPESNEDDAIQKVIRGEVDFGVASIELLAAYGERRSVIAYSTFLQMNDITLYAREHTLISTANDLVKLRLTIPPGLKYELLLRYFLSVTDTDESKVSFTISKNPLQELYEDRADVIIGSSLTTPYLGERLDLQLTSISLQKFGLDLPGQTLFSSREYYENNKETVDEFILASIKGWKLGLEVLDEIALELTRKRIAKNSSQTSFGLSFFQTDQLRDLTMYPIVTPGVISIERWKKAQSKLHPILESKLPLDESFIHDPVLVLQRQAKLVQTVLNIGVPIGLILSLLGFWYRKNRKASLLKYEADLRQQATHDSLTGLPNREFAFSKLDEWIRNSELAGDSFHVMFLDLDGFKAVNDTASHSTGDKLLVQVSERLDSILGENEWLARIGGDEFLVLSKSQEDEEVDLVTDSILEKLKSPFSVDGSEFLIGVSIGVANYPHNGTNGQLLLSHADEAMYHAKDSGKNQSVRYTEELSLRAKDRIDIANRLRSAISLNEFSLCYQPITCIKTGRIVGAEALLRWNNPELGMISPDRFIPIAEETGTIIEIGNWVMETALSDMSRWNSLVDSPVYVSVNVSPRQFQEPEIIDQIFDRLQVKKISPSLLKLEITENLLVKDTPETALLLERLNQRGIDIFLDDFGTGYSSLSYLKKFPIQVVKIDRAFINEITTDGKSKTLVNAIIALGRGLDMTVVSEGVETGEQLGILEKLSCDYAQGYYFSKPIEYKKFIQYMTSNIDTVEKYKNVS